MLAAIAADYGARHVETLTGFKWLARADADRPAHTLVYAYEEAIGHCVDPAAVRDKDGISAAVLRLRSGRRAARTGLVGAGRVGRPGPPPRRAPDVGGDRARRRRGRGDDRSCAARPPARLGGVDVDGHRPVDATGLGQRTDALIFTGGDDVSRCGWRCGRREPSRRSRATSRFASHPHDDVRRRPGARRGPLARASAPTPADLLQRGPN